MISAFFPFSKLHTYPDKIYHQLENPPTPIIIMSSKNCEIHCRSAVVITLGHIGNFGCFIKPTIETSYNKIISS